MKTLLFATLALTAACLYSTGCAVAPKSANQRLVTDASGNPIACTVNADCPTGSECESEAEHGQKTTFCQLHDE